jgi:RNA polymerase sigma factor (sigma-70 family)
MTKALDEIRRLFTEGTLAGLSDGQLLERFTTRRDGEAFAAIVARQGAMVLSVSRSSLGPCDAAAADVFQATFLVLVRRAGSFPVHGSLAGWLYRVARRVARQARVEASRRRARERVAAGRCEAGRPHDPARDELSRLVHEELAQLPERYRTPILLCDLHGLTRDQAAEAIGCPPGTVAGRLARARERLRERLTRRGVNAPAVWPATMAVSAWDLSQLLRHTTHAAVLAARGEQSATTAAALLAARASRCPLVAQLSAALALLIALGAVGTATAVFGSRTERGFRDDPPHAPPAAAAAAPAPQPLAEPGLPVDPADPGTADLFAGKVVDSDGRPLDGAKVYITPGSVPSWSPGPTNRGAVRAVTAAGGLFRFSAKDLTFTSIDGLPARRPGLLIAAAEGYGPDCVLTWGLIGPSHFSHRDPVKGADLTLTLPRDDVPIRGRLLGPDGRPLAGASVRLFGLDVPWKRDLDSHLKKWKSPEAPSMSFDYEWNLNTAGILPGVTTEAVTDADGRFRLGGLGRDRLARLSVRGLGVTETEICVMTREAPEARSRPEGATDYPPLFHEDRVIYGARFTLTLRRGRTITGVVRDKVSGAPLADVGVGPGLQLIAALESNEYPYATDAQGRFAFEGLSPNLGDLPMILAVPKPGQPYFFAKARVNDAGEAVADCPRGIPFHLTLRDEAGRPVQAEVTYSVIGPNESSVKVIDYHQAPAGSPLSRAARQADGSYLGVALPGPGVVLAKTRAGYRPAHVDPKAFFAPGRKDWSAQELAYGNHDMLTVGPFSSSGWLAQHEYAAIVLINPPEKSGTLYLAATVMPDRPRQVTLLDAEGLPVVGAKATGLMHGRWERELTLRAATLPLTGLHPDRARRITFVKGDRKLIGFLLARGDGDAPYTVRMQPWATVTGRIVDERGTPQPNASLAADADRKVTAQDDPVFGVFPGPDTDGHGRFRVERLVPGQSYSAILHRGRGRPSGPAFEGLVLAPGEVRDLGDLQLRRSTGIDPKPGTDAVSPAPEPR